MGTIKGGKKVLLSLYIEIDALCIAIVVLLYWSQRKYVSSAVDNRLFGRLLLSVLLILLFDMLGWIANGAHFAGAYAVNLIANYGYALMQPIMGMLWVLYVTYRVDGDLAKVKKHSWVFCAVTGIYYLILLSNPITGAVFTIDSDNFYVRGSLFTVTLAIIMGYILYASVTAAMRARGEKNAIERVEYQCFAGFFIPAILGAIVQSCAYGLPVVWVCSVFALLMVYINIQNNRISIDALTQLNNRGQFDRYINAAAAEYHGDSTLYIVLLDVDYFKKINDRFGHSVGDRAIVSTANILKKVCARNSDFLARYGGDEFVMVCRRRQETGVWELAKSVNRAVDEFNANAGEPYKLSLSIGYAGFSQYSGDTVEDVMAAADENMYRSKKAIHGED